MKRKHTPLVVGNWKMNPATINAAKEIFLSVKKGIGNKENDVDVVIAPPIPFVSEMGRLSQSQKNKIKFSAQDLFYEKSGAYTGEVSVSMLKSVGIDYAIVGHSERRAQGQTSEEVSKNAIAAANGGLTVILCVGEDKRDEHGNYFNEVETQLRASLKGFPKSKLKLLSVMYEPVWAISKGDGKGKTATPEDANEMKIFIQKILSDIFGRKNVDKVRILYGGSVNAKNAKSIFEDGEVDGFVVGGASLRANEFAKIVTIASEYAKS